jgi:mono/diheme cytochrome c family protein
VNEPDKKRGADLYATFCTPCHGAAGAGDGAVVKRGFPAPPSLLAARAVDMKDGQLFHIVTYGQANMPGYASQIDEDDRWRVVAHVREMQRSRR